MMHVKICPTLLPELKLYFSTIKWQKNTAKEKYIPEYILYVYVFNLGKHPSYSAIDRLMKIRC